MFTLYVIGMNENNNYYAKPRSCDYSGELKLSNLYLATLSKIGETQQLSAKKFGIYLHANHSIIRRILCPPIYVTTESCVKHELYMNCERCYVPSSHVA